MEKNKYEPRIKKVQSIDEPFAAVTVKMAICSTPWVFLGNTWITIPSKPKRKAQCILQSL